MKRRQPVDLAAAVHRLPLVANGAGGAPLADLHEPGLAQHLRRHPQDLAGQRRREEQRLAIGWQRRQDALHVGPEAHVHHAVGLVEHEHLHPEQVHGVVPHVVHQPARRRDDDVHAGLERAFLRAHLDAAEHRRRRDRRVVGKAHQRVFDLHRQLAGRRKDERARVRLARRVVIVRLLGEQPLQDRRREGQRLARAGLRAGHDVVFGERSGITAPCTGRVPSKPRSTRPAASRRSKPSDAKAMGAASASTSCHGKSGGGDVWTQRERWGDGPAADRGPTRPRGAGDVRKGGGCSSACIRKPTP